jgi:hypothetical protein
LQKQSGTITGALAGTGADHSSVVPMLIAAIIFTIGLSGLIWLMTKFYQRKQQIKNEKIAALIDDMAGEDHAVL